MFQAQKHAAGAQHQQTGLQQQLVKAPPKQAGSRALDIRIHYLPVRLVSIHAPLTLTTYQEGPHRPCVTQQDSHRECNESTGSLGH